MSRCIPLDRLEEDLAVPFHELPTTRKAKTKVAVGTVFILSHWVTRAGRQQIEGASGKPNRCGQQGTTQPLQMVTQKIYKYQFSPQKHILWRQQRKI